MELSRISAEFKQHGVVNVTDCFDYEVRDALIKESLEAYKLFGKRKEFISKHGGHTPRIMYTVSKDNIDKAGNIIKDFYYNKKNLKLLSTILKENIHVLPYEDEKYVINIQRHKGDTHGWHWDDYAYALLLCVEAPKKEDGGFLQSIYNKDNNKFDIETLNQIISSNPKIVESVYKTGDMYLLYGSKALHRVHPLVNDANRMTICFTYCNDQDLREQKEHGSVVDLYT
jgi:hypothetical protein